jgi:hypothetical protein
VRLVLFIALCWCCVKRINSLFGIYDVHCFSFTQDVAALIFKAIGRCVSECGAMLAIMQRYRDDSEIQIWACSAIRVHAAQSFGNKQQLGSGSACELILMAIDSSNLTNIEEVIIWGCKALKNLLIDCTSNRCLLRSIDTEAVLRTQKNKYHSKQALIAAADEVIFNLLPQTPTGVGKPLTSLSFKL